MLAPPDPGVVDVPQLRTLILRIPLAELVPEREHPLLRPGLLLVSPRPAEHRIELVALDRIQQCRGLQPVATRPPAGFLGDPARVDGFLHRRHHQPGARLGHPAVPELQHLREVVPGVHVHDRKRDPGRPERPLGQREHNEGVLAAREQQHRPLELGSHLAHDVDRLGFEHIKLRRQVIRAGVGHQNCSPCAVVALKDWGTWPPFIAAAIPPSSLGASSTGQMRISGSVGSGWL